MMRLWLSKTTCYEAIGSFDFMDTKSRRLSWISILNTIVDTLRSK